MLIHPHLRTVKLIPDPYGSRNHLIISISSGFPDKKYSANPNLCEFWEIGACLSYSGGVILMNHCIMIPKALCNQILQYLHAAHQGTTGMSAHANQTAYWPGINAYISNHQAHCVACNQVTPSQSAEPLILTPAPK